MEVESYGHFQGDCTVRMESALNAALAVGIPNSYIFVFTDSEAASEGLFVPVITAAENSRITVRNMNGLFQLADQHRANHANRLQRDRPQRPTQRPHRTTGSLHRRRSLHHRRHGECESFPVNQDVSSSSSSSPPSTRPASSTSATPPTVRPIRSPPTCPSMDGRSPSQPPSSDTMYPPQSLPLENPRCSLRSP